jgi:hypothetical protein
MSMEEVKRVFGDIFTGLNGRPWVSVSTHFQDKADY